MKYYYLVDAETQPKGTKLDPLFFDHQRFHHGYAQRLSLMFKNTIHGYKKIDWFFWTTLDCLASQNPHNQRFLYLHW